jgi:uncharacterized protein YaiI (UPF0178 family)
MLTIWIDADAAPRDCKDVLFRASERRGVPLILVANHSQRMPNRGNITFIQVGKGFDVADDYIAEHCVEGDLVITNDIPLAAQIVEKGAMALRPRGEMLDAKNVRQQLAMRDFMDDMRGTGVMTGGPPPFGPREKKAFANALDRWLTQNL